MGLHFSRIWERMFGKKEMRILMVGLDAAGKVGEKIEEEFESHVMEEKIKNCDTVGLK